MLAIVLWIPHPTPFQRFAFRVVLSLAAAGVAAMIPGFLQLRLGSSLRAGGALGVFAVLYFLNPASLIAQEEIGPEPDGDPRTAAEAFLRKADTLDFSKVWRSLSDAAHHAFDRDSLRDAFLNVRPPLGDVATRKLLGVHSSNGMPGWPSAHYRAFEYETEFESGARRIEFVTVMSEDGTWKAANHTIHKP